MNFKLKFNEICHNCICFVCRHLSEEGLKKISEDGKITNVKDLMKRALDVSFIIFVVGFYGKNISSTIPN